MEGQKRGDILPLRNMIAGTVPEAALPCGSNREAELSGLRITRNRARLAIHNSLRARHHFKPKYLKLALMGHCPRGGHGWLDNSIKQPTLTGDSKGLLQFCREQKYIEVLNSARTLPLLKGASGRRERPWPRPYARVPRIRRYAHFLTRLLSENAPGGAEEQPLKASWERTRRHRSGGSAPISCPMTTTFFGSESGMDRGTGFSEQRSASRSAGGKAKCL